MILIIFLNSLKGQDDEISSDIENGNFDPSKMTFDPNCHKCKFKIQDPDPSDLVMYLHALKYSVSNQDFFKQARFLNNNDNNNANKQKKLLRVFDQF